MHNIRILIILLFLFSTSMSFASELPKFVAPLEIEHELLGGDYTDPITNMDFIFVKGGCYQMGDTFGDGDSDEKPVHEVCVDDYYIGKHEVTQGQW